MSLRKKLELYLSRNLSIAGLSGMARILVIHPSGRESSSGPYLQSLSEALAGLGHALLLLGERHDYLCENGITWLPFTQKHGRLAQKTLQRINTFKPDLIILVGIRSRSMLAALEVSYRLEIPMLVQAEDDDQLAFSRHYPQPDLELLNLLDKPCPTPEDVTTFMARIDWTLTQGIWSGTISYRLVEPVLRAIVLHRASSFGAIWHPMSLLLQERFSKPVLILPPVTDTERSPVRIDRDQVLASFRVPSNGIVIFVSGAVYDYSNEFEIFLKALNCLADTHTLTLVMTSKSRLPLHALVQKNLTHQVQTRILDLAKPEQYERMLQACDIVAVPGVADEFNRLRLPGRIPRAMAAGKPIFTFACGFGESLVDGRDAVLTRTDRAEEWALKLQALFDKAYRVAVGINGRAFAQQNFSAGMIGRNLSAHIQQEILNKEPVKCPSLQRLEAIVIRQLGLIK